MKPHRNLTTLAALECPIARCPTCDAHTTFIYLGEQHYPERVARAAGMTPVVHVWRCHDCQTTLVTPDVEL
jgi:hypothetical protein